MEVIQFSVIDLWKGLALHETISVDATLIMYIVLGVGTALKVVLYFYCLQFKDSDSVQALAEDHINDVGSNLAAIITASIAGHIQKLWYIDPVGKPFHLPLHQHDVRLSEGYHRTRRHIASS